MTLRDLLSLLAIALTFVAFLPYIAQILRNRTRPHAFSWIVWGATTGLVFFAQLSEGGGAGAWPIGVSGAITLAVAALAVWKRTDLSITRTDWLFLIGALSALPLWFWTADALSAVIVLTIVDLLGFGPTLRKAYAFPHEEDAGFFALFAVRNGLAIGALERLNLATLLFPAATGAACLALIALVFFRRRLARAMVSREATETPTLARATAEDLTEICTLLRAADLPTDDVSLTAPQEFILARRAGGIVGVVGVELYGATALLRSACVIKPASRAGLGARLCEAAEAQARAAGASNIYLLTTTAAAYFSRRGYQPVDRASAPAAVANSPQFRDLCPASAVLMMRVL